MWICEKLELIKNIDNEPKGHWEAVNDLLEELTGHHKRATIIKLKDKATRKIAKTTRESVKIFYHYFKHNV